MAFGSKVSSDVRVDVLCWVAATEEVDLVIESGVIVLKTGDVAFDLKGPSLLQPGKVVENSGHHTGYLKWSWWCCLDQMCKFKSNYPKEYVTQYNCVS